MHYDGLGVQVDPVSKERVCERERAMILFDHSHTSQAKGFAYMLDVAQSKKKRDSNIVPSAQYNVGRAYFMVV